MQTAQPAGAPVPAALPFTAAPAATRRRRAWRKAGAAFLITILLAQLVALAGLYGFAAAYEGRILPNVSVAGVPVGGMKRADAEAAVRARLLPLSTGYLTLRLGTEGWVIPYRDLGRDYDMRTMLDQAFSVGHTGTVADRSVEGLRSLMNRTDVGRAVAFDRTLVARRIAEAAAALRVEPTSARLALSKDAKRFVVASSIAGREIDVVDAVAKTIAALDTTDPADVTVQLRSLALAPAATTQQVKAITTAAQALAAKITSSDLTLAGGGREFVIKAAKIKEWIRFERRAAGTYVARVNRTGLRDEIGHVANALYIAPRNATIVLSGGSAFGYLPSANGRRLETGPAFDESLAALEGRATGGGARRVSLKLTSLRPSLTSEAAAKAAPRMALLGTWTTRYVPSKRNFFGANIRIPAATINGDVVAPGEWFDFWQAVGPVTRARGFGDGGVIRNGRTEPTGALAGGICSASTTLFNAAARAGLQIGQRHNHYYYIDRYPLGLDATVLKGSNGPIQNMTFRNDTDSPLLIRGINTYGHVRFDIYGVPTGRATTFSTPTVRNVVRAYDTYSYSYSLPSGYRERLEVPTNGMDVSVTRTVRDASGTVIHRETWSSHYSRINGLVVIGRG